MMVHSNSAVIKSDFWKHSALRLASALMFLREIAVTANNDNSWMGGAAPSGVYKKGQGVFHRVIPK